MDIPETPKDPEVEKKYKLMLSLWLSFCAVGFIWFITKVLKGRQQIRYNFTSIEEQLKRMQAVIEEREQAIKDDADETIIEETENDENNEEKRSEGEDKRDDSDDKMAEINNENDSDIENDERSKSRKRIVTRKENEEVSESHHIRDTIEDIIQEAEANKTKAEVNDVKDVKDVKDDSSNKKED